MIPVLETPRLLLRGRTLADFPAYAAIWANPAVVRFTSRAPVSEEDAWTKFVRMEGLWRVTGFGWWIVEEKATQRVIGEIGAADFRRDIKPSLAGMPEFGWMIDPIAQGKGYAKEALGAALRWADAKFRDAVYCCIIDDENTPSIKVAVTHGFQRVGVGVYKGGDVSIYHRPSVA